MDQPHELGAEQVQEPAEERRPGLRPLERVEGEPGDRLDEEEDEEEEVGRGRELVVAEDLGDLLAQEGVEGRLAEDLGEPGTAIVGMNADQRAKRLPTSIQTSRTSSDAMSVRAVTMWTRRTIVITLPPGGMRNGSAM